MPVMGAAAQPTIDHDLRRANGRCEFEQADLGRASWALLCRAEWHATNSTQVLPSPPIVIAGFLFARGPQIADALSVVVGRMLSLRGKELVQLAGAMIRSVSRGVIGIALLQAFLGGAGFLVAGVPAPGVLGVRSTSARHTSDRTGDPVRAGRHLELDGDGADGRRCSLQPTWSLSA